MEAEMNNANTSLKNEVSTSVPLKSGDDATTPQTSALTSTINPLKRKTPPTDDTDAGSRASVATTVVVVEQDGEADEPGVDTNDDDGMDEDADADADAEAEADGGDVVFPTDKQGTEEQHSERRHCSPHPHDTRSRDSLLREHSSPLSTSPSNPPSHAHAHSPPIPTRSSGSSAAAAGEVTAEPRARARARSVSSSGSNVNAALPRATASAKGDVPGQGEYEKGHVVCEVCNSQVSFRDEETGVFSLDQWNLHRKTCTAQGNAGNRSPVSTAAADRYHHHPSTQSIRSPPTPGHPSASTRSRHPPSPHSYRHLPPGHPDREHAQREVAMYNRSQVPHVQTRSASGLAQAHLHHSGSSTASRHSGDPRVHPLPHPHPHTNSHHPHSASISSPPLISSSSHSHAAAASGASSLTALVHESLTQAPVHPPTKRRRAKRTEEERIAYLKDDPYVARFEPYRVLCASCDKWIRLRPNSTYCSIPWDAHRKSCLSKKISNKNTYALEERNSLFAKDPDIRKFDAERILCAVCDQWVPINSEDHLQAVQAWIAHRSDCAKRHAGAMASGVGIGGPMVGPGMGTGTRHGSLSPVQRGVHMMPHQGSPVLPPLMAQDQRERHALALAQTHAEAIHRSQNLPPPPGSSFPGPGQRHLRERHLQQVMSMEKGSGSGERPRFPRALSGGIPITKQEIIDEEIPSAPPPPPPPYPHPPLARVDHSESGSDADADADADVDADADADIDADGDGEAVAVPFDREREHESPTPKSSSDHHDRGDVRLSRSPPDQHAQMIVQSPDELLQQQQQQQAQGEVIYSPAAGIFPPGPAHESRRRNAEQRAATLRSDTLIKHVEANRVFCRLCEKWVQLRQDSSYCAYPWFQHRGKCLARHQRRAQKAVEIAEIKARRAAGHAHAHSRHGGMPPSGLPPMMHHREEYPPHPPHPSVSHAPHRPHPNNHGPFSANPNHGQYIPHPSSMSSRSSRYARHYAHEPGRDQDEDELMSDGSVGMGIPPGIVSMSVEIDLSSDEDFPEDRPDLGYARYIPRRESGDEYLVHDEDDRDELSPPLMNPNPSRSRSHSQTGHGHFSSNSTPTVISSRGQSGSQAQAQGRRGGVGPFSTGPRHQERGSRHEMIGLATQSGNEGDGDDGEGVDEGMGRRERDVGGEDDIEMDIEGEGDLESQNVRMPPRTSRHRPNPHSSTFSRYPSRSRIPGGIVQAPSSRQHQLVTVQPRGVYQSHPGPSDYPPQQQHPYPHSRANPYGPKSNRSHHGRPYSHGPMPSGNHASASASFAGNVASGMPRKSGNTSSRALADLDSVAGRRQFVSNSISYLFQTTYEPSDDLSISALLTYLNAAMPLDKHEDFDTAEVVKAVVALKEKGRILFEGDLVRRIRNE